MKIFISGSLAYDRIMDFPGKFEDHILPDKIHVLNVSFEVNGLTENFGGTAGNIAYSLALLGEKPTILAAVGKDFDRYGEWLMQNGIDLSGIARRPDEFTSGAYITTDLSDNQITGFNPGAMKFPSKYAFDGVDPRNTLAIVSPGNAEDMLVYSRTYKQMGIGFIFDPGQQIPVLPAEEIAEMIDGSRVLITNDYELDMIKKMTGLTIEGLLGRTRAIITTLGEKGSVILDSRGEERIPVVKTDNVVDPTGAGDAYRSGLIKGMVMGKTLSESARIGAACAAYAVECYGTQEHRFTPEEFWNRYREYFNLIR
ncbi:MAG: carbohydrate kinase family protein [Desulfobacterales bacterium]